MEENKKKKIMTAMECCATGAECDHCPYSDENIEGDFEGCYQMHWDAQELLRELLNKNKSFRPIYGETVHGKPKVMCGRCKSRIGLNKRWFWCAYCGAEIDWNGEAIDRARNTEENA